MKKVMIVKYIQWYTLIVALSISKKLLHWSEGNKKLNTKYGDLSFHWKNTLSALSITIYTFQLVRGREEERKGFGQFKCYLSQSKGCFHCPAQRDSLFHLKIYLKSLNSVGGRPWPKPGEIRDNYLILFPLNIIQLPGNPNSKEQN